MHIGAAGELAGRFRRARRPQAHLHAQPNRCGWRKKPRAASNYVLHCDFRSARQRRPLGRATSALARQTKESISCNWRLCCHCCSRCYHCDIMTLEVRTQDYITVFVLSEQNSIRFAFDATQTQLDWLANSNSRDSSGQLEPKFEF